MSIVLFKVIFMLGVFFKKFIIVNLKSVEEYAQQMKWRLNDNLKFLITKQGLQNKIYSPRFLGY